VRDELGDLLLQVVFQSQMYSEQGAFDFQDVVQAITDKLIRRHPHVFQAEQFAQLSPEDVSVLWKEIKQKEKQGKPRSRLDELSMHLHCNRRMRSRKMSPKSALTFQMSRVPMASWKKNWLNSKKPLLDKIPMKYSKNLETAYFHW
jgi:Protein containing tetrapyrrole methyltransferase domain and MazG-like (predicted pyrophosphatase) domain